MLILEGRERGKRVFWCVLLHLLRFIPNFQGLGVAARINQTEAPPVMWRLEFFFKF